jgi:hypothetical protein
MVTTAGTVEIELLPGKRGEPPIIRGNLDATVLLNDLLNCGFGGLNFNPGAIHKVRASLRRSIARGGLAGSEIFWTKRELHKVLHIFNELRDYSGDVVFVGNNDFEASEEEAEATAEAITRHELMHSAQRRLGANGRDKGHAGDAEAFMSHPLAVRAARALVADYKYADDPDNLLAEIGAHLVEGTGVAEKLGLTQEEGRVLAQAYWDDVLDCNGSRVYRQRALFPLIEQWSLSNEPDFVTDGEVPLLIEEINLWNGFNEPDFGTDGEAQPRESRGSRQREGAPGKPPAAGRCSQIGPHRTHAEDDRQRAGPLTDAYAGTGRRGAGSVWRSLSEHRQERQAPAGRVAA